MSYAQLFLETIAKKQKAQKQRRSRDDTHKENNKSIKANEKIDFNKVYDWKVVEEKHIQNNQICQVVDYPRDYIEIIHDDNNDKNNKEEMEEIKSHGNAYDSPLNDLFPLSRFLTEDSNEEFKKNESNKTIAQSNKEDNEEEEEDKKIDEKDSNLIRRERLRYKATNTEKDNSIENDLNVTENQMRDLNIEVKQIQNEYNKQKQLLSIKNHHLINRDNLQENRVKLLEKKKKYNPKEHVTNIKQQNQLNEIDKTNNVVVNNTNQHIISNYPNVNGIQMMPNAYPYPNEIQMQMPNLLPMQILMDNYSNGLNYQYPQSSYFNPSFPTELPYIPSIHQQPKKANQKKQQKSINKDSSAKFSNSKGNILQMNNESNQSNDLNNSIEKPKLKRVITYKPKTIKGYKKKYEGKNNKKNLGGLGPNIGTMEWNEKHQRAIKRKEYSDNVDSTSTNNNNIRIIHPDYRLNTRLKSSNKDEQEQKEKNASWNEEDSLNNDEGLKLPIDEELNNNRIDKDNKMADNVREVNKEYCSTQETNSKNKNKDKNKNSKAFNRKKVPVPVPLPLINKRNTKSSSHIYRKYKLKAKQNNNDDEIQFNNDDLNRLYQNHQTLLAKVENIKSSLHK